MKRIVTLVLGAVGLSALAAGGLAVAGPPGGFRGGPGGHDGPPGIEGHVLHLIQELDLTDAQKQVLRDIREENMAEREAHRSEREAHMAIVREQLLSDVPDAALLHSMIDQNAAEMQARAHDRLDTVLEIQAILTPEQRAQVAASLDEARERHEDRREQFRSGERTRVGEGPRGRE
ncbi:MAG: Spy/CpxP family protein refolding chaperone [Myxococcota bacterium]